MTMMIATLPARWDPPSIHSPPRCAVASVMHTHMDTGTTHMPARTCLVQARTWPRARVRANATYARRSRRRCLISFLMLSTTQGRMPSAPRELPRPGWPMHPLVEPLPLSTTFALEADSEKGMPLERALSYSTEPSFLSSRRPTDGITLQDFTMYKLSRRLRLHLPRQQQQQKRQNQPQSRHHQRPRARQRNVLHRFRTKQPQGSRRPRSKLLRLVLTQLAYNPRPRWTR
jgi:hypothetical protein